MGVKLALTVIGLIEFDPRGFVGEVFVAMVVESVIVATFCASAGAVMKMSCHRVMALPLRFGLYVLIAGCFATCYSKTHQEHF